MAKEKVMDIIIRQAEVQDVAKMFTLWKNLRDYEAATYGPGGGYPYLDTANPKQVMPWFEGYAGALMDPERRLWVALVDNNLVGYVYAQVVTRGMAEPSIYIYVHEMFVVPEFRGKPGVARALEAVVEDWAAAIKAEVIECSTVATDKQISRWTRKGFTPYTVVMYRKAKWKEQH